MAYWVKQGLWPNANADPYWSYVSYLLGTTSTNAQTNATFLDASTNNFTITRVGTATQGSFTPYGTLWSNYFDGSGDYLTAPTNSAYDISGGDFTVEAWINLSALPAANNSGNRVGGVVIYSSGFGGGFEIAVDLTNNLIAIGQPGSASLTSASYTFAIGQWYHIAVCRASGTNRIFVNGTSLTLTANTFPNNATGSATLRIGAGLFSGGYEHYFPGFISNFRIVKGTGLYSANFTPAGTPLTAVSGTSILTCQSNRFRDASSNSAAITAYGDARVSPFSPFVLAAPGYTATDNSGSLYLDAQGSTTTIPNVYTPSSTALDIQTTGTVECWIYPTARPAASAPPLDTVNTIWAGYGTSLGGITKYYAIGLTGTGYLYISVDQGAGYGDSVSTTLIPLNTWTHVACVRSGGANKFYVNGVDVTSTFPNPNLSGWPAASASDQIFVGVVPYLFGSYNYLGPFQGYISNFRLVKGTAVYTAAFTPPTTPVTAITNTSLLLNFTNAGIYDNSMNSDMVLVGSTQVSTGQAKFGTTSALFNGNADYIYMRSTPALAFGTGDFTIECWFYFTSFANGPIFFDGRPSGTNGAYPAAAVDPSGVLIYYVNGATQITGGTAASLNTWNHFAVARSGTSTKLFLNGVQQGSTYSDSNNYLLGTNRPIIGGNGFVPGGASGVNGYIDDLRVTKGVARYTSNFTPPTAAFPTF